MTAVIHGLFSGLIWSAILGSCLIAIAAVVTTTVPASTGAKDSRGNDSRPGRIADQGDGVPGPSRHTRLDKTLGHGFHSAAGGQKLWSTGVATESSSLSGRAPTKPRSSGDTTPNCLLVPGTP
jgi:hypothetical protein